MKKTKWMTTALVLLSAVLARGEESFRVSVRPDNGRPHARAIIFIPGLSSHGSVWDAVAAHYDDRYDCHVLTLAGFAGVPPVEAMSLETVRTDLAAYIRRRKLERPVIVGHSLGGVLALSLASAEPGLAGPLVVVDAVPFLPALWSPDATVDSMRGPAAAMRERLSGLSADAWRRFQQTNPVLKGMVTRAEDQARLVQWGIDSDPHTVAQATFELLTLDLREALARITSPALVVAATKGAPPGTAARYEGQYTRLPQHRLVEMDGARHFVMYDDPDRLIHEMDVFLDAPR
jgi:N-formylmaleamate deformylase